MIKQEMLNLAQVTANKTGVIMWCEGVWIAPSPKFEKGKCACDVIERMRYEQCAQRNEENFICTQPLGHRGPHIACGMVGHGLAIWE